MKKTKLFVYACLMQIRKNHFFNVIKLGEGEKNKYFESSSVCVNKSASGNFENVLTFLYIFYMVVYKNSTS